LEPRTASSAVENIASASQGRRRGRSNAGAELRETSSGHSWSQFVFGAETRKRNKRKNLGESGRGRLGMAVEFTGKGNRVEKASKNPAYLKAQYCNIERRL
jgi:hypothetical protein